MEPATFLSQFDRRVADFWKYWSALPRAGAAPHLRDYLDRVPPDLQPSVLIIDFYSQIRIDLRLVGTMMAEAMGMDSGGEAPPVYGAEKERTARGFSWTAANHPCGYAAKRPIRSRGGLTTVVAGVVLPLTTDRPGCKTLINFTNLAPVFDSFGVDDHVHSIESLAPPIWLDIGFGVPSQA